MPASEATADMSTAFPMKSSQWYEVEGRGKGGEILNLGWCLGHEVDLVIYSDSSISQLEKNLTKPYLLRI